VFITTPAFLDQHRQHREQTRRLLASATANGQLRLVEMNQQVLGTWTGSSRRWRPTTARRRTAGRWPMPADNIHHLVAAARRRALDTRARAVRTLRRLDGAGRPVSFDTVAREARVSRSWLYGQADLQACSHGLALSRPIVAFGVKRIYVPASPAPRAAEGSIVKVGRGAGRRSAPGPTRTSNLLLRRGLSSDGLPAPLGSDAPSLRRSGGLTG
jgi:hypothetical protein